MAANSHAIPLTAARQPFGLNILCPLPLGRKPTTHHGTCGPLTSPSKYDEQVGPSIFRCGEDPARSRARTGCELCEDLFFHLHLGHLGHLGHIAYVTFWSVAFVTLFRDSLSLRNALLLALVLYILVLVVFFPVVGWGFLGLAVSPKLIVASLVPHVLFAVFLWGLCRLAFRLRATSPLQH